MSDPVDTSSQDERLNSPPINLRGVPPDPATFDGPLNEFIELHGTAVAYNTAAKTKADYPAPATATLREPPRQDVLRPPAYLASRPQVMANGPVGPGRPINYTSGVIDRRVGERVRNRRYPHKDPRP